MLRSVIHMLLSLVLTSAVVFILLRIVPGDPAAIRLGVNATPEAVAQLQHELGTDRPFLVQYLDWIQALVHGNLGQSLLDGADLTPIILDRLAVSLILVTAAVIVSTLVAVTIGTLSALYPQGVLGRSIAALGRIGVSLPGFIVALGLVTLFANGLGWLPANGWAVPALDPGEFLHRLILPTLALASVPTAVLTRHVRAAMLDVGDADYVRASMAQGKTRAFAFIRHGLPNAFVTISTLVALVFVDLIVGAVVIEQVFDLPGIGTYLIKAVAHRDMFAVQGAIVCVAAIIVVTNGLVDAFAKRFDTRLAEGGEGSSDG